MLFFLHFDLINISTYIVLCNCILYKELCYMYIHSQATHIRHIVYIAVFCYIHKLHFHNQLCEQDADSGHVGGNGDWPAYVDQFGTLSPAVVPFHLTTPVHQIGWYVHIYVCLRNCLLFLRNSMLDKG